MTDFNILLTSVGRRSYLVNYFKDALDGCGRVIVTNSVKDTAGMVAGDVSVVVPDSLDHDFIPAVLEVCRKYRANLLFSLHDLELTILSSHIEEIKKTGTFPVLASEWFCQTSFDKYETFLFAQQNKIHTCKTYLSLSDCFQDLDNKKINFPLVVKPRWGFGSFGLNFVYDKEELVFSFNRLRKQISNHYISNFLKFDKENSVIIQEMILGQEYGVDVINNLGGEFVTCFVEKKSAMRAGETDLAEVIEDKNLYKLGKRIGNISKHPGVLDLDVIVKDAVPYLLEMNPRFGGHYPFAHVAGADIPSALIAWGRFTEPPKKCFEVVFGTKAVKDLTLRKIS